MIAGEREIELLHRKIGEFREKEILGLVQAISDLTAYKKAERSG